jgi:hypothetical protein
VPQHRGPSHRLRIDSARTLKSQTFGQRCLAGDRSICASALEALLPSPKPPLAESSKFDFWLDRHGWVFLLTASRP